MGGFTVNGLGAKDYFKKLKYLGEHECPFCHNVAQMNLEKSTFKVALFYIPTIPLKKEQYSIMCKKCGQGRVISENMMHRLMLLEMPYSETEAILHGGSSGTVVDAEPALDGGNICPKCGAAVQGGMFCGMCGTKLTEQVREIPQIDLVPLEMKKRFCNNCGSEIEVGDFCGMCGTRYVEETESVQHPLQVQADSVPAVIYFGPESGEMNTAETDGTGDEHTARWECFLCGTMNGYESDFCSLCGQKRQT